MPEVERQGSARIFISYRREDSAGFVRALLTPLRERFGGDRIFKDTDNIPPGQDFVKVIQRELESCSVLLSVIGKTWATIEDPRTKKRRLENPGDYLRIEVATALKDEHVIVIPVLVDHAGMPRAEDLPEELQLLARRNAIELSDSRWDTDVERLIHAIEDICNEPALPEKERTDLPSPDLVGDAKPPSVDPGGGGFEHVERKRKRQIAEHMKVAREAFAVQDFEAVVAACERAIWLDPQEHTARDLAARARAAIDEREIQRRLAEAQVALAKGDLAAASEAIDAALARSPDHAGALKLRQDLLRALQERERQREVDRLLAAEIKSAQSRFDEEDFPSALNHIDDALALAPESVEARELRERIVAARDELHRARELKRRAQQTVADAQAEFAAGKHDSALLRLEQFAPPHELVTRATEDLRRRAEEARETARREKAEQDAAEAAARARRDAGATLAKVAEAIQQKQFAAAQELVEAARVGDPTHPDVAQWAARISDAVAAEELAGRERKEQARREEATRLAAAEKARQETEEHVKREAAARRAAAAAEKARQEEEERAKREEAARRAAAAAEQARQEKEERAKREEAARRAAAAAGKAKREKEEQTRREEAAARATREEARRREEEARLERAVAEKLDEASRVEDHEVAIVLLNEALTLAPGDQRLQALIGERTAALDQQRVEALEKAAAEEALRRRQERQAREERTRREREEREERARLAREKKEKEGLARETPQSAQRPAVVEAAGPSEPRSVLVKTVLFWVQHPGRQYLAAAAIVVFAITAGRLLFRDPITDGTQGPPPQEQTQGPTTAGPTQGPTTVGPAQGPTIPGPTPGPTAAGPTRGPTIPAPTPGPTAAGPTRGPTIPAPTPGPTAAGPARGPTIPAPTPGPTAAGPARGPTIPAPTPGPTTAGPTQGPATAGPTQGPTTAGPTQGPATAGPTQGPTTAGPTQGPVTAGPTQGPATAGPTQGPATAGPTGVATPAGPNLAAERASIQQLLDRYVAAYTDMDEPGLKQIDQTFRGIPSRQLLRSVELKLSQVSINVRPDGLSAVVRATQNFSYTWNRSGFPATSTGALTWNLRKVGATWTVVP